ncbi:NAD(P)H-quinone oxidoreductase [Corynebacterium caspium]|uniref:NAD(P)H-quinone oxidoreductase n=1 Tax=Corynebacterium caspium TaxID=234828 RepID=UPI000366E8C7|nr:NAD(P)H-quinone oxidoreductase [Corynebacterium caspium]
MFAYRIENKALILSQDIPKPQPQPGEVLVKVVAAGVNRADIAQVAGYYPPPPGITEIPGLECSGIIVDANGTDRTVGEEVCCLLAGGAYAEYVAVPVGQLAPIPAGMSLVQAAGVIEVAATVWSNLGMVAQLQAGQKLLIHGGAGGIGTMAIQVAKNLGAEIAVTAGSAEKLEYCQKLGAQTLINYCEEDFSELLKGQMDVILDIIGARYLEKNLKTLAFDGQLVIIGLQGGTRAEIDLGLVLPRRLSIHGTTLRARSIADKSHIVAETIKHVWPLLSELPAAQVLPFSQAAKAHQLLNDGAVSGKLVLEV